MFTKKFVPDGAQDELGRALCDEHFFPARSVNHHQRARHSIGSRLKEERRKINAIDRLQYGRLLIPADRGSPRENRQTPETLRP